MSAFKKEGKDNSDIEVISLMTSLLLDDLCKDPFSKKGHILVLGDITSKQEFWEDTIQCITGIYL